MSENIMKFGRFQKQEKVQRVELIQQTGIDICSLPKVNSIKHSVTYKYYFSKCLEAKLIQDESASTIAQFFMR